VSRSGVDLLTQGEHFIRRVYDEILRPAFPPDELDDEEAFVEGVLGGTDALGLALVDEDGAPLTAIVAYPFAEQRVLLIGYLATRAELRSQGLGADLLELAKDRWHDAARYDLVLGEVEDPRFHPGAEATKRLSFYERQRAVLVARPYFQPRLPTAADRVYGMLLIVFWRPAAASGDDTVPGAPIAGFLRSYFEDAEGGLSDDRPLVDLLAAYEAPGDIRLRPLCSYDEIDQIRPER
jgi:GNAT superfamily N-acetyltransferase